MGDKAVLAGLGEVVAESSLGAHGGGGSGFFVRGEEAHSPGVFGNGLPLGEEGRFWVVFSLKDAAVTNVLSFFLRMVAYMDKSFSDTCFEIVTERLLPRRVASLSLIRDDMLQYIALYVNRVSTSEQRIALLCSLRINGALHLNF